MTDMTKAAEKMFPGVAAGENNADSKSVDSAPMAISTEKQNNEQLDSSDCSHGETESSKPWYKEKAADEKISSSENKSEIHEAACAESQVSMSKHSLNPSALYTSQDQVFGHELHGKCDFFCEKI